MISVYERRLAFPDQCLLLLLVIPLLIPAILQDFVVLGRAVLKSGNLASQVVEHPVETSAHLLLERWAGAIARFALATCPSPILSLDGAP